VREGARGAGRGEGRGSGRVGGSARDVGRDGGRRGHGSFSGFERPKKERWGSEVAGGNAITYIYL
jgi:hypothetical protein